MPCSTLFHGYIRTMSLGPTTTTSSLALFKTHNKTIAVKPPLLLGFFARHRTYRTHNVGFWNVYRAPRHLSCRELTCLSSSGTVEVDGGQRRQRHRHKGAATLPFWQQQSLNYGRYAYQDVSSSEDSDRELGSSRKEACGSTLDNIDEWRWKLTMLLRNENEQEVVSREKKDRRDFDQLSALAARMGLYCRQYSKVVVFSKAPLPNYRSDLDTKRPQREVIIPYGLQSEVDYHLRAHHSRKSSSREGLSDNLLSRSSSRDSIVSDERFNEQQEPSGRRSVAMEKILRQKSLNMLDQQQKWQESPEGQKMLELRKSLPAYKEREALLKVISENQVVVVSGETGCGKTTQLPQYILESEIEAARGAFCNIICTQPRRISAMSVSERVAAERGEALGESVGYKVRLEGMKGRDTRLLFCTTGILLRRLLVDRTLKGVTHVIVDEIHERGMNEDFLLIVLKELLPRRPELRLILMSATLNAELFSSFFGGAPTMHIPGFTYPVRALFLENILEITGYRLTQYNQIDDYGQEKSWKMQKQAQSVGKRKSQIASSVEDALEAADFRDYNPKTRESLSVWNPDSIGFNLIECVLCHIIQKERPGAILVFMTGWDDINSLKDQLQSHPLLGDPSRVLLLACHGSMPSNEQKLIFDKPEDGVRKIVLATNMAETSITINDVVFVVDCGKAKETSYDALNNTPCLLPSWISKAAARQRRGRAGRVQPGECYHLYPRCVYDAFSDYQLPELLRTPLQSLCLQIKSLRLGSISEFLSKALQPPEPLSVQNAVEYLKIIGALDEDENLTSLGRNLSMLPVEPKLGKMLILGAIFNCLDPVMTVVAGLSSRDPFLMPFDKKDLAESAKAQFSAREYSDHLALVRAYEGWKEAEREQSGYEYCWRNFLSAQTLKAIDSLRKQFFYLLKDTGLVDRDRESCNTWSHDEHLIRAIICAGLFPGLCSVMKKLYRTIMDNSYAYSNMEEALDHVGVGLSTELVAEILQRLRFEEKIAFRFFTWAGHQENYAHEPCVFNEMIDILSTTKYKIKQFQIVCEMLDYMKRHNKNTVPVEVLLTILRQYCEKYLTHVQKFAKKKRIRVKTQPEVNAFNLLLDALCKCSLVVDAEGMFKRVKRKVKPDANTYNILFFGWCRVRKPKRAMKVLEEMIEMGLTPDNFTYSAAIDSFCRAGMVTDAVELFEFMRTSGSTLSSPTAKNYVIMIVALIKNDRMEECFKFLEHMISSGCLPDVTTYKELIEGMCLAGKVDVAYKFLQQMGSKGYPPDIVTYNCFLKVLCDNKDSDEALKLFGIMVEAGCVPSVQTYNMLISMFFEMGDPDRATDTWNKMDKNGCAQDIDSYCVMIEGLFGCNKVEEACCLLEEVVNRRIKLPYRKFDIFLTQLSNLGDLRAIHRLSEHMRQFYNPAMARRFALNEKRKNTSLRGK